MTHHKITVHGVVQGVGFRPFVSRLANHLHLQGCVYNDGAGVIIHIQGSIQDLERFTKKLCEEAPGPSWIQELKVEEGPLQDYDGFTIENSHAGKRETWISPDLAPCEKCIQELFDPTNRRYHYPFINCTYCGPRYTIIQDIPYDRKNTTMSSFTMCNSCEKEYTDITDRRYHAQPNACQDCGPHLIYKGNQTSKDPLSNTIQDLKEGKIVAIKGIGGIHLACDAKDRQAILRLRKRKHRETKPLAIMVKDIETAKQFVTLTTSEIQALTSTQRPIVLCTKKDLTRFQELSFTKEIGILLPYSPLHYLILEACPSLVMTSANLQEEPVLIDNEEALEKLNGIADSFLLHDRIIQNRCDDSLMRIIEDRPYFIRRSRGYVPLPIKVNFDASDILACGAHQKGSFALGKENYVYLSPYIGNLESVENQNHYKEALALQEKLFTLQPQKVVCDLHPDYASTLFAQSLDLKLIQVQHHKAHMASCMADNQINGPCFGIIWDGTGLGEDGSLWGGECFIGDFHQIKRVGSIRPIPLIGKERAILEIGRIAYALADTQLDFLDENFQKALSQVPDRFTILSSGVGRLLDGLYALITKEDHQALDGFAPMALEAMAQEGIQCYPVAFYTKEDIVFFDWKPMVQACLSDPSSKNTKATKVHNTLISMAIEQVKALNKDKLPVVLSGGCFQNKILLNGIRAGLQALGYQVYWHQRVSCTDEGIALGQLALANERM